jgi:putative spermidine/putrescine transport system substrate-binding protein
VSRRGGALVAGRSLRVSVVAALSVVALAACSPPSKSSGSGGSGTDAASATSAADLGGMSALEKAAKKEGTLNVIALPPDWANYGTIIKTFSSKYGIKVSSQQPDAGSQDEIDAAKRTKGTDRAPDVFDLGQAVALANTSMYAKYKVSTWKDIGDQFKDPDGAWVNDYGGYMAIGYDSAKVPAPTSIDDLLKPAYKGKVALNGDPTTSGAGFSGVLMTAVAKGGSADDIAPGIAFWKQMKKVGNYVPVDPNSATIKSGQTPVVIDWDYTNAAHVNDVPTWKVTLLPKVAVGGFYYQAINAGGPHPAAARLWEEFLFSDQGQNLWLAGGARPIRADAMVKAGTIDKAKYAALPKVTGTPVIPTAAQTTKLSSYLAKNWSAAVK